MPATQPTHPETWTDAAERAGVAVLPEPAPLADQLTRAAQLRARIHLAAARNALVDALNNLHTAGLFDLVGQVNPALDAVLVAKGKVTDLIDQGR